MSWLYPITCGLLAAPVGSVLGVLVCYAALALRGVREQEGRRGLLAGAIGGPLGAFGGFWLGHRAAGWLAQGGGGGSRGLLAGALLGLPAAIVCGALAWVVGARIAERKLVSEVVGLRSRWALIRIAAPTAAVAAALGYLGGRWAVAG